MLFQRPDEITGAIYGRGESKKENRTIGKRGDNEPELEVPKVKDREGWISQYALCDT